MYCVGRECVLCREGVCIVQGGSVYCVGRECVLCGEGVCIVWGGCVYCVGRECVLCEEGGVYILWQWPLTTLTNVTVLITE